MKNWHSIQTDCEGAVCGGWSCDVCPGKRDTDDDDDCAWDEDGDAAMSAWQMRWPSGVAREDELEFRPRPCELCERAKEENK